MPLLCGRLVCSQRGKTMTRENGGRSGWGGVGGGEGEGEGCGREMDPRCAVTNYITSEWSALINIRVHFSPTRRTSSPRARASALPPATQADTQTD